MVLLSPKAKPRVKRRVMESSSVWAISHPRGIACVMPLKPRKARIWSVGTTAAPGKGLVWVGSCFAGKNAAPKSTALMSTFSTRL